MAQTVQPRTGLTAAAGWNLAARWESSCRMAQWPGYACAMLVRATRQVTLTGQEHPQMETIGHARRPLPNRSPGRNFREGTGSA